MAYFFLAGRLLTESSFFSFISKVYEDFVSKEDGEYEYLLSKGSDFKLNALSWPEKCADQKALREENGAQLTFRPFALSRINTLITMDIDNYVKDFRAGKIRDNSQFVEEYTSLVEKLKAAPYLGPVIDDVLAVFRKIPTDILPQTEQSSSDRYLVWTGPVELLCQTFTKLAAKQPTGASEPLIKASSEMLEEFIVHHFRNKDGEPFTVEAIRVALTPGNGKKKSARVKTG